MGIKQRVHARRRNDMVSQLNCIARLLAGLIITFSIVGGVFAQPNIPGCGAIVQQDNGPFDYRNQRGGLEVVERFHFTPLVESLTHSGTVGADLDFTLRAFPNHHRALMAMMRLGEKVKSPQPSGARYSVECWFERALRFRPDDSIARMIYATFLAKAGREPETVKQLELAAASAGDNAFTHYNVGLIYFDNKKYDQALAQAHKAYSLGFPRPELRDQLISVGKWKESEGQSITISPKTATQGGADEDKPRKGNE